MFFLPPILLFSKERPVLHQTGRVLLCKKNKEFLLAWLDFILLSYLIIFKFIQNFPYEIDFSQPRQREVRRTNPLFST